MNRRLGKGSESFEANRAARDAAAQEKLSRLKETADRALNEERNSRNNPDSPADKLQVAVVESSRRSREGELKTDKERIMGLATEIIQDEYQEEETALQEHNAAILKSRGLREEIHPLSPEDITRNQGQSILRAERKRKMNEAVDRATDQGKPDSSSTPRVQQQFVRPESSRKDTYAQNRDKVARETRETNQILRQEGALPQTDEKPTGVKEESDFYDKAEEANQSRIERTQFLNSHTDQLPDTTRTDEFIQEEPDVYSKAEDANRARIEREKFLDKYTAELPTAVQTADDYSPNQSMADRRRQRGKRDLDFIEAARELHDAGKIDRGVLDPTTGQVFTEDSRQIERARRKQSERSHLIGDPTAGTVYTEDTARRRGQETKNYDVGSYNDTAARIERAKNTRYKMDETGVETPLVLSPEERAAKTVAAQLPEEYDSSYEFMAADSRQSEPMRLSAEQRREALERARLNEAAEREDDEAVLRIAEQIHARVRRERAAHEAKLLGQNPDERKMG